jgi:hypothetical protein
MKNYGINNKHTRNVEMIEKKTGLILPIRFTIDREDFWLEIKGNNLSYKSRNNIPLFFKVENDKIVGHVDMLSLKVNEILCYTSDKPIRMLNKKNEHFNYWVKEYIFKFMEVIDNYLSEYNDIEQSQWISYY